MRQLPVDKAFAHTVKSTLNNLRFAFHISWPWMLVLLPFNIAGNIYTTLNFTPPPGSSFTELPTDILAVILGMFALAFLAFASIAVSWHRYILADEVPFGLARLRLDKTVWNYVGSAILVAIVSAILGAICVFPFALVGSIALALGAGGLVLAIPLIATGFVFALACSMRLGIVLPAVAMERSAMRLTEAWDITKGNHWRTGGLMALVMLCLLGVGFFFSVLTSVLAGSAATISIVTLVIVQMAVNWISTIWNVTVLTSLYGYFVEERDF